MGTKASGPRGLIQSLFKDAAMTFVAPAVVVAAAGVAFVGTSENFTPVGMFDGTSDRVLAMQNGEASLLSKDFMCRTRTNRCTMDLGDGIVMSFANFGDFMKARDLVEGGLHQKFKGIEIPVDVNRAMIAASVLSPYPYEYWLGKVYSESKFQTDAYNKSTKAMGITQFLPSSGLEALYYMGKSGQYSFIPEANQVERYIVKNDKGKDVYKYRAIEGVDQQALLRSVFNDPLKSVFAAEAYNSRYLKLLNLPEGETITSLHAHMVHWQGGGGAQKLFNAYESNPDRLAYTVFASNPMASIIDDNKSMFMGRNGTPFTIEEMLDYMTHERGIGNYAIGDLDPELRPPIQMIDEKGSPEISVRGHAQEIYTVRIPDPFYVPVPMAVPTQLADKIDVTREKVAPRPQPRPEWHS